MLVATIMVALNGNSVGRYVTMFIQDTPYILVYTRTLIMSHGSGIAEMFIWSLTTVTVNGQ